MMVEIRPVWKAGIYARLSAANDERKNESIDTQIEIAKEYIRQSGDIELIQSYTDLGRTGTNFEREGFKEMMQDIRCKRVNCVIVKDFSRFGRNYIETGNYIEKVFPFMKVRFIAVTDEYDSEHVMDDNARLSMNLKNIVNELYAKDIAEKVKTSKKVKQEMGSYTGGAPPYGYYLKTVGEKRVLFPQTETKDIVVKIFEMFGQGCSYKEIREYLYEKRIQRPKVYYGTNEIYCPEGENLQQWTDETIKQMLKNPCYIGTLFQARIGSWFTKEHKLHEVNEEDISIVKHTHESIVSEKLFYMAAQRFERQSVYSTNKGVSKAVPQKENIFADIIYCGECGKRMRRSFNTKKLAKGNIIRNYYYVCLNRNRVDQYACQCEWIPQKVLITMIKTILEKEFSLSRIRQKDYCRENEEEAKKKKAVLRNTQTEIAKRQENLVLKGSSLYLKYREGEISREAFLEEKGMADKEIEVLRKKSAELEIQEKWIDKETEKRNRFIRGLMKCKKDIKLDRTLVESLIKQIYIYSGRRVEIIFNYRKNDLLNWEGNR